MAYNKTYRDKYARLVKRKIMVGCWTAATVVYTIRSARFFGKRPEHFSRYRWRCRYHSSHNSMPGVYHADALYRCSKLFSFENI